MGTFRKGILGPFAGTVGTVVGGSWKGIDYMRSRPGSRKSGSTPAQDVQRLKFAIAIKFLTSMRSLLAIRYKQTGRMTGTNSALANTLKNAIKGVYPELGIDYKMVEVARGSLPGVSSVSASSQGTSISFTWKAITGIGIAKDNDKVIVVVYHQPTNQTFFSIGIATRADGSVSFDLPSLSGETVETWLSFISDNGRDVATSVYTGTQTLA